MVENEREGKIIEFPKSKVNLEKKMSATFYPNGCLILRQHIAECEAEGHGKFDISISGGAIVFNFESKEKGELGDVWTFSLEELTNAILQARGEKLGIKEAD